MIKRYANQEMINIWSEENKFQAWLEVEKIACEAFSELDIIPRSDIQLINQNANFKIDRILELEQETKHDVVAFTRAVSESLGPEGKWIHFGLTSTDVVDTALGFVIKQANIVIEDKLTTMIEVLKSKALEYKYTVQMGRTHGVHAELTTFGLKMALYYDEMNRNLERFKAVRLNIEVGKISGAVGTYANIDPFVQDYVSTKLGLESSKISTQTLQRDRHAEYLSVLALIASSMDKMAIEFRHLQRTEVREVEERFSKGQKGSSAMPHKKNPISSENISGLSRVVRGYMLTAYEDIALWHERDISHSSVERIILPDATTLIDYMLTRFTKVIDNLYVNQEQMLKNISITNNVFFSQKVMLSIITSGISREKAYDLVQPIAVDCFNNNLNFKVEIKEVALQYLSDKQFEDCFNTEYHLDKVDYIFTRLNIV